MSFTEILKEVQALHDKKAKDYGRTDDPYKNVRGSEDFGIAAWVGATLRANDKMKRLQLAAQGSPLANEGIEDSLIDIVVYMIIALDLFRDSVEKIDALPVLEYLVGEKEMKNRP